MWLQGLSEYNTSWPKLSGGHVNVNSHTLAWPFTLMMNLAPDTGWGTPPRSRACSGHGFCTSWTWWEGHPLLCPWWHPHHDTVCPTLQKPGPITGQWGPGPAAGWTSCISPTVTQGRFIPLLWCQCQGLDWAALATLPCHLDWEFGLSVLTY